MKPIQEMSQEELNSLVSFTDTSSTTYYYSKISSISSSGFTYAGEHLNVSSVEGLKRLKAGLDIYETYKLFNGDIDMEFKLKTKIDEILSEHITMKFDGVLQRIDTFLEGMSTSDSAIHQVSNLARDLQQKVNTLDIDSLESTAKRKFSEIKDLTEGLAEEAKPALKELTAVLSQLKRIVTPKEI